MVCLGEDVLESGDSFAVTRHASGKISVLLWNYCHYTDAANDSRFIQKATGSRQLYDMFEQKPAKQFTLHLSGLGSNLRVQTTRFDCEHGSVLDAWLAMVAPEHIRREDLAVLRQKAELEVTVQRLSDQPDPFTWTGSVQPHGVTLLDISASAV